MSMSFSCICKLILSQVSTRVGKNIVNVICERRYVTTSGATQVYELKVRSYMR